MNCSWLGNATSIYFNFVQYTIVYQQESGRELASGIQLCIIINHEKVWSFRTFEHGAIFVIIYGRLKKVQYFPYT